MSQEKEIKEKGIKYYLAYEVYCQNCNEGNKWWQRWLEIPKGIKIEEAECPNCGCKGTLLKKV